MRLGIRIEGVVQGVGFRPRVKKLAERHGLAGFVRNDGRGAYVEVEGGAVHPFLAGLRRLPAPIAIERVEVEELVEDGTSGFEIRESEVGTPRAAIPPDRGLCAACAADYAAPGNRRQGHLFVHCTDCGPRATIALRAPFDRERTSMADLPLCDACAAEYDDPDNRRHHAQVLCCPDCGPTLDGSVDQAREVLATGGLVGIKGLGGMQLLALATNQQAVARVRQVKGRPDKPLAVLVRDIEGARRLARISPTAEALLSSGENPIVLVPWEGRRLASNITRRSPSPIRQAREAGSGVNGDLGLMLPTTALHLALCEVGPLVCTSANRSGEPIPVDPTDLDVDLWLDHDRAIVRPLDDSVVRPVDEDVLILRRSRGYVPRPIDLDEGGPTILALGAFLKVAPALAVGDQAIFGAHIGDLSTRSAMDRLVQELDRMVESLDARVEAVACDLHPDLPTTRLAEAQELPVVRVQHHVAHAASVIAEHQLSGPVLAFTWDGIGYGEDGTLWGSETLLVEEWGAASRVGHLRPMALVGGDKVAREPARVALSLLHGADALDHPGAHKALQIAEADLGESVFSGTLAALGTELPVPSTAMGRLFAGLAVLLGHPGRTTYEGQAESWLEHIAVDGGPSLPLPTANGVADWRPLVEVVLDSLVRGVSAPALAGSVHRALARWIEAQLDDHPGLPVVAAGGCFQNAVLLRELRELDREVLLPRRVPVNDGGLALGQLHVARRRNR